MQRSVSCLAVLSLLTAAASAQCFEQAFGQLCPYTGGTAGYGDDDLFDLQPMNITFPMAGLASSYTHAHICTNGVIYLTNGANSTGSTYAYNTTAFVLGTAGTDPRIAPLWIDLECVPANGGGIYFNNTIPGKFVVTWANVDEWAAGTPTFTMQAQLFANGDVTFYYSTNHTGITVGYGSQFVTYVGVTEGNGVVDPGATDLSLGTGVNLSSFCMYEAMPIGGFDLQDQSITFVNAGTGYLQVAGGCTPAYHEVLGHGCYDISDSFYQYHDDATTAPGFSGQSMVMTPAGTNWLVTWGGGSYVTPVAAANLGLTDDGEVGVNLSAPFPTAAGPVPTLFVGANGIVSLAANSTSATYAPDEALFLACPVTAFWSWHDFNPSEVGSGPVSYFEAVVGADTIAYITWEGVENYPTGVLNPSTLQFQFNLTTGAVTFVWQSMDGDASSPYGSAHLMGWSPGGPSTDGGSQVLSTLLPIVTVPNGLAALDLSAAPAPISAAGSGTVVTYTTNNLFEMAPGSGIYVGLAMFSLGQVPGGLDLSFLGAPGCSAYIASIDFSAAMVGVTSSGSVVFPIPAGLPSGLDLYSQSANLITPNSLPNGQNAFGMTLSNGVKSHISSF